MVVLSDLNMNFPSKQNKTILKQLTKKQCFKILFHDIWKLIIQYQLKNIYKL